MAKPRVGTCKFCDRVRSLDFLEKAPAKKGGFLYQCRDTEVCAVIAKLNADFQSINYLRDKLNELLNAE
jgi:hypothetical protein